MLLVKTSLRQSPLHGLGVFSEEYIARDTILWQFNPLIDRIIDEAEMATMPPHTVEYLEHFCEFFPEFGLYVLSGDHDRYTNHSDDPNTRIILPNGPHALTIAARDIEAGEELTCDYGIVRSRKWLELTGQLDEQAAQDGAVLVA